MGMKLVKAPDSIYYSAYCWDLVNTAKTPGDILLFREVILRIHISESANTKIELAP